MKKFYLSIVLQIFGCGFLFSQEQTVQEFQHLIMYGQSMSTGAQSYPSLSVENVPGNFMIGDQIWIKQGNSNFKELKPLIGTIAIDYQNQLKNRASLTFGETPLLGLSNHLQLKQAGAGIKYIASSNGENGKSIEVLSKNGVSGKTKYYDEYFLKSVRSAVDIAKKKGYRISSPAIFWLQGEYNYINLLDDGTHNATSDKDGYKELLVTLKNDMQNDIMSAYGQDKKPMFITYQAGSLRNDDVCSIGLAALELSNTHEDIICSGPVYQMPHRGVHMDPNGYRWYGEMMAKVYYKTQVLKEDFKPLQPKQIYRKSPNSIGIIFHVPKPPLVFDTNLVRPLYNYGFKIKNNGETQNITDIKIEGNQVIIACGQDLTGNVEVIYGQENVIVYNKLVYKAGNLRDSDDYPSLFTYVDLDAKENGEYIYPRDNSETTLRPDYEPRDANGNLLYGKPYPLYNFGVAFSYTLEADRNSLIMPGFFPKQEILYVKKGGNGDGSSWGSPLGELADALKIAGEQNMGEIAYIKQIWVAKGTYTPLYIAGNGTNPINDKAFVLPKNVEIYGGFSGTESSLSQRDWKNNQTILSGDLNGNDGADFLNRGDNTYHVVISSGDLGNSVLDGFTIKGGNAGLHEEYCKNFFNNNPCHYVVSKKMIFTGSGGGVYLSSSSTRLNNLIISDNRAVERGAGMVIDVSSPALNNVIIKDNRIDGDRSFGGAGIYSYYSTPTLLNVTIKNNKIESINSNTQGGGILNYNSTSKLTNVIISDNIIATPANTTVTPEILSEISGFGGAIFNKESPITLINALISGNKAKTGGGVFIEKSDNSKLINVTISDNQSSDSGSALFNHSMTTEVYNSIIWGNTPVGLTLGDHEGKPKFYYSLVQNSTDTGNHNISGNTNPLLTAGYQLQPTSPLLNKGNNEYLSGINNDLKNDPRIFGDRVDLGAYEYKSEICSLGNLILENTETTYDNTPHSVAITNLPSNVTVEYKYKGTSATNYPESTQAPTNAGNYIVTATVTSNSNPGCKIILTALLNINKAPAKIISQDIFIYPYDGSIKNVTAALNHTETSLVYESPQGYINAGGYTVIIKSKETTNYSAASKEVTLTITPIDFPSSINFTLEGKTTIYNGTPQGLEAFGNFPSGTILVYEYERISPTISSKETEKPTNAGKYLVTATIINPNYNTLSLTNYLTINKAQSIIQAENTQTFTYDGSTKNISATLNHNEAQLTYNPQQGYVNAGTYSIIISAPETTNYLGVTKSEAVTLNVLKASNFPNTVKFEDATVTYDGNAHNLQVIGLPQGTDVTYENNSQTTTGTYTVKATLNNPNYEIVQLTATLTINKAQSVIKADDTQTFTYDESIKYISAKLNHNEAQLTYNPQQGYVNAGIYSITVKAEETTNYLGVTQVVTLTILEANSFPNTVKFENAAVTYDGNAHSLQVTELPQGTDVT
ncbi:MAG: MBG domain-containing protein [Flavobacteriaceae bacterium]|jgi:hypothetical protein|nr:MBG domain-containing protein [Flavobacteriaceae bacterium]